MERRFEHACLVVYNHKDINDAIAEQLGDGWELVTIVKYDHCHAIHVVRPVDRSEDKL